MRTIGSQRRREGRGGKLTCSIAIDQREVSPAAMAEHGRSHVTDARHKTEFKAVLQSLWDILQPKMNDLGTYLFHRTIKSTAQQTTYSG